MSQTSAASSGYKCVLQHLAESTLAILDRQLFACDPMPDMAGYCPLPACRAMLPCPAAMGAAGDNCMHCNAQPTCPRVYTPHLQFTNCLDVKCALCRRQSSFPCAESWASASWHTAP